MQCKKDTPPDFVKGTYTNDLNINKIHDAIVLRFQHFESTLPELYEQIHHLEILTRYPGKTINDIKYINEDIQVISNKIDDYENKISYKEYISEVEPLLRRYNLVASNQSKGIIVFKKMSFENDEVVKERLKIIKEFLDIAKNYIKLDIIHKITIRARCPGCNIEINNSFIDDESGLCICPSCGYERESISHHSTYKDSQRVNIGNRNSYDDCENFRKALHRFQGKQNHHPPDKLYDQLDIYFRNINKLYRENVLKQPLTEDGRKKHTSRQMMYEALNETNNSAYYEDINLILHLYWGWALPDISNLEDRIMEDYITTQQIYNAIPNKDRDASLNIQFRLFVHLKAVDYPCTKDDFKIQTSRDSLIFHNEMWKIMCEKSGVKYYAVI